jgi:ABC-2 type transport system ATP-binding protein
MVSVKELKKSFRIRNGREARVVEAVRGIDLQVPEASIFGFVGPNGAGKTTTLKMLATLIKPDSGQATIAGADLLHEPAEVRRRIGYVAQGASTWDQVTAREELVLQARMYGMSKAEAQRRTAAAVERFQLAEYADRRCKSYSGGQRRRVEVALGIIHRPKVVFLDEPTAGLDPQSRAHMWDEIRRLRAEGMTVFITTHYLHEADALCDRVAIIDRGEIVTDGSPAQLKREISGDVVVVGVNGAPSGAAHRTPELCRIVEALEAEPYVRKLEMHADGIHLHVDSGASAIPRITRTLDHLQAIFESIEVHRPSLDDVFLAKTGRSLRES